MNYPLQAKSSKKQPLKVAWKVVVLLIVVVFILSIVSPNLFGSVTFGIAKPLWKVRDFFVQSLFKNDYFRSKSNLIKEKNQLEKNNQDLVSKLTELEVLRAENNTFRTILSRVADRRGIAAPVIAHPTQTPYDVIVVDLNEGHSVSVGKDVVLGNIALGKVSEVGKSFAKVNLYSSPNATTMGVIVNSGVSLELQGKGGGNFSVRVPRDTLIEVDELVVLPSDPALALARVSDIEESERDSFKLVRLISPVNIFSLHWVEILE